MKRGWELKKINEVCMFGNGLWAGKKPPYQKVGVIRNTNFTNDGSLNDSDIVELNVEKSQYATRKLQYGDIILEKSGGGPKQPVGRVIIFDKKGGDFSFSNFTSVIRIVDPEIVDFNYLHRFLYFSYISGETERMQSHSTGIRNLKFDEYKAINIPIPPLSEQKRIVSILNEVFASISEAKNLALQNLKNAQEIFESYLREIFEQENDAWEENKLKIITTKIGSGATPRGGKENYKVEGISLVRSMNVHDREFIKNNLAFIDQKQAEELDGVTLQGNDVLFNITGASVARCCVFPKEYLPARVNQHVSIIRANKEILNPEFLCFLLTSKPYKNQLLSIGDQGATRQAITKTQIENFKIRYPSLDEQQNIVHELEFLRIETQKMKLIYQKKLDDLEELKKSILQKAFAGELLN